MEKIIYNCTRYREKFYNFWDWSLITYLLKISKTFLQPTLRMYLYPGGHRLLSGKVRGLDSFVTIKAHRRRTKIMKRNGAITYAQNTNNFDRTVFKNWLGPSDPSLFSKLLSRQKSETEIRGNENISLSV